MSEDDMEKLGLMVDRMDNLAAGSVIPMPNELRLMALDGAIRDMRDELRSILQANGFDSWG